MSFHHLRNSAICSSLLGTRKKFCFESSKKINPHPVQRLHIMNRPRGDKISKCLHLISIASFALNDEDLQDKCATIKHLDVANLKRQLRQMLRGGLRQRSQSTSCLWCSLLGCRLQTIQISRRAAFYSEIGRTSAHQKKLTSSWKRSTSLWKTGL